MIKKLSFLLLAFTLFTSFLPPKVEALELCEILILPKFSSKIRYPIGVRRGSSDIIKFGFESEYTLDRISGIVNHYAPRPDLLPRYKWQEMTNEQRVAWVKKNLNTLFKNTRIEGGLELATQDHILAEFIPRNLILDETGNLEIILPPAESLEVFLHNVEYLNAVLGIGSMQATVGVSRRSFFLDSIGISPSQSFNRNIGFLNFVNDYDILEKLYFGYARWLKDNSKTKLVARFFEHPFLGPMTKLKHDKLSKILRENNLGNGFSASQMKRIGALDSSFKYMGSTAYRPDIATAQEIIVLEVRDAHSSMDVLTRRLLRNTMAMGMNRSPFTRAARFNPLDTVADYEKFPMETRKVLEQLFPDKVNLDGVGRADIADEILAGQVYRNFAFPLKDWSHQVAFLGKDPVLSAQILHAQEHYLEQVSNTAREFVANQTTKEIARAKIQSEVALFSRNSGLFKAFKRKHDKIFNLNSQGYEELVRRFAQ